MSRNWLEWLILGVSVAAIAVLVGFLGWEATRGERPAAITIEARMAEARTSPAGWEVPVTVRNDGRESALGIVVAAEATVGGEAQTSELTLELLAPGTEAEVVAAFTGPPDGEVTVRLVGYEAP